MSQFRQDGGARLVFDFDVGGVDLWSPDSFLFVHGFLLSLSLCFGSLSADSAPSHVVGSFQGRFVFRGQRLLYHTILPEPSQAIIERFLISMKLEK
jgi:hypothetical protein